jgi:hypothetical protein
MSIVETSQTGSWIVLHTKKRAVLVGTMGNLKKEIKNY